MSGEVHPDKGGNRGVTSPGYSDGLPHIVDYKITSIDNTPPGLYESQLDFYAFVRHLQTGAETVNTSIAFLREGEVKERTITGFDEIRKRIERAAELCGSGPYTPNHGHCGMCPFRKGCVKCNAGACEQ